MVEFVWWGSLVIALVGGLIGYVVTRTFIFICEKIFAIIKRAAKRKIQINTANDIKK